MLQAIDGMTNVIAILCRPKVSVAVAGHLVGQRIVSEFLLIEAFVACVLKLITLRLLTAVL